MKNTSFKTQLIFKILGLIFFIFGCGVKSKPLPPDEPTSIGKGQRELTPPVSVLPEAMNPELIDKHFQKNKKPESSKEAPKPQSKDTK